VRGRWKARGDRTRIEMNSAVLFAALGLLGALGRWRWRGTSVGRLRRPGGRSCQQAPGVREYSRIHPGHGRPSSRGRVETLLRGAPRFRRWVDISGDRGRRPPYDPSREDQEEVVQGARAARGRSNREDDRPCDGTPDAVGRIGVQTTAHLSIIATQRTPRPRARFVAPDRLDQKTGSGQRPIPPGVPLYSPTTHRGGAW
jgi:hypothetical protein